jgi:hypothetical protein
MEVLALLSALGGLVGLIGGAMAEGDYAKARSLYRQAVNEYGDDILPVLDRLVAQEVGDTAFSALKEDASLRGAQTDVMRQLGEVYESAGQTPADKAALQAAQNEVAQRAASDYASLQQHLARTGQTGNAALEAATSATVSGQAAGQMADMALRAQMEARQRALQALLARGQLAGQVRGDDWRAASARASAQDALNLFNARQRTEAQLANNQRALQEYEARMRLLAARNAARAALADTYMQSGQRTAQRFAGLGDSLVSAGAALAG